jgi:hypothetical protein
VKNPEALDHSLLGATPGIAQYLVVFGKVKKCAYGTFFACHPNRFGAFLAASTLRANP